MSKKHGHHGGAWKVAYADFVTAMMALFMVLWLTSQDPKIKQAVERSFTNPFSSVTKDSTGIIPNKDTQAVKSSSGNFDSASAVELNFLRKINTDLMKSLDNDGSEGTEDSVKMDLTSEGLSINVFDRAHKPIFESGSCKFTNYGDWIFSTIAWQIARYKDFGIELDGHTESGRQPRSADYDGFDLSADRANAVRRKLLEHGVMSPQIKKVAGFGATVPMPDSDPTSEVNSRVTVLLKPSEKNASSEAVP